ncbi:MAG: hypothetical protein WC763_03940 [Candidatus Paceibacterota bacterium]|jgi:hypothetical protein
MKRIISSALFLLAAAFLFPTSALAGSQHNLTGFAWSSNIGWISFNSTNDHNAGVAGVQPSAIDYGVNFATSTGYLGGSGATLTGYAWSSNIGWIQFGGLSGFPTGPGTTADNAKISGSNLVGWAKALSAAGAGWDGWISLSGTSYGPTLSGSSLTGYAWGSSVVGWVSFDVAGPTSGVKVSGGLPAATLDAQVGGSSIANTAVTNGQDVSLVYTLSNLPVGTTCSIAKTSGVSGISSVPSFGASGSTLTGSLTSTTQAYSYLMTCSNGATSNVAFTVAAPQPAFYIGNNDTVLIQFVSNGRADSETKTVALTCDGYFAGNVRLSIGGVYTGGSPITLPASSTISYSLSSAPGSSTFTTTPTQDVSCNGNGYFKIRLTSAIPNSCVTTGNPIGCNDYSVKVNATDLSGTAVVPVKSKYYTIRQSQINPDFQEI